MSWRALLVFLFLGVVASVALYFHVKDGYTVLSTTKYERGFLSSSNNHNASVYNAKMINRARFTVWGAYLDPVHILSGLDVLAYHSPNGSFTELLHIVATNFFAPTGLVYLVKSVWDLAQTAVCP